MIDYNQITHFYKEYTTIIYISGAFLIFLILMIWGLSIKIRYSRTYYQIQERRVERIIVSLGWSTILLIFPVIIWWLSWWLYFLAFLFEYTIHAIIIWLTVSFCIYYFDGIFNIAKIITKFFWIALFYGIIDSFLNIKHRYKSRNNYEYQDKIHDQSKQIMIFLNQIDTSNVESVTFILANQTEYTFINDNLIKIALYFTQKSGKTQFMPNELKNYFDYFYHYYDAGTMIDEFIEITNKLRIFVKMWWVITINRIS
jgi:hypothetical protein